MLGSLTQSRQICHDSAINLTRHYIYYEDAKNFVSLGDLQYHNRCILTVNYLVFPSLAEAADMKESQTLCLFSAATDGRVAVWTPLLAVGGGGQSCSGSSANGAESEKVENPPQPLAVCQAHQSGINDISIQQGMYTTGEPSTMTAFYNSHTVSEWFYLIATVGDDNALVVLGLTLSSSPQTVQLEVLCSETSAHASSITGV